MPNRASNLTEDERFALIVKAQAERLRRAFERIEEIERHCERIARGEESPAPPDAEDE